MFSAKNTWRWLVLLLTFAFSQYAFAEYGLNLSPGVTVTSQEQYNLHSTILWIILGIAIVVYGVIIYSIIHHRKSKGHKAAEFHESVSVEIIWTILPFVILIAIAVPATGTLIRMHDTSTPDMTVKITGYQWKWKYDYIEDNISFFSNLSTPPEQYKNKEPKGKNYLLEVDEPLVLPINKKIRLLITANDVLHAWWVPQLGVKQDAIPGYINESWAKIDKPGTYRGQCAELCGAMHGFMPIVVVAVTEAEYADWVKRREHSAISARLTANKKWTKKELIAKGETVYKKNCAGCHQVNGKGVHGAFPALKGNPILTTGDISEHIDIVLHGTPGTAMQAFGRQLSDVDIAAVITYKRNAWGNQSKQSMVQPSQIKSARIKR